MRYPSLQKGGLTSGKQPMSLQLTSGSGEPTPYEVTFQSNKVMENLTLLSYSYCITGISKPAVYSELSRYTYKIICKSYYTR